MRFFANCLALYISGIAMGGYIAEWGTPRQGSLVVVLSIITITLVVAYNLGKLSSPAVNPAVAEK
jgi:hypothetical protein